MRYSLLGLSSQGDTRVTTAVTIGYDTLMWCQSDMTGVGLEWYLQIHSMKLESVVISDQPAAVNTFPCLVHTARHATGVDWSRST